MSVSTPNIPHTEQARLEADAETADMLRRLRAQLENRLRDDLPGSSRAAGELRSNVLDAADLDRPVLLICEPGGPVEPVARSLHAYGRRSGTRFETLCGKRDSSQTLQTLLVTCGLLAACEEEVDPAWRAGGTLFLARAESLAMPLQKLLADCLERQSRGEGHAWSSAVRLIVSLEADSARLVGSGALRRDLHEAASKVTIAIPRLRDRRQDVVEIAGRFLERRTHAELSSGWLTPEAASLLERHDWPGDIDDLEGVLASALATRSEMPLTEESLLPWLSQRGYLARSEPEPLTLREMERRLIEATFARCDGNRERTARALGIGLRTLSGKLREYGYPPRGGPGSRHTHPSLLRAG